MNQKLLVIFLVFVLMFTACQSTNEPAETKIQEEVTLQPTPQPADSPTPEPEPTAMPEPTPEPTPAPITADAALTNTVFNLPDPLLENTTMSIILDSVTAIGADTVNLSFSVENKSAYTMHFGLDSMCVNYVMVPRYYLVHQEVEPNSSKTYNFEFSFEQLGQLGIEQIQDIRFDYSVLDAGYVVKYHDLYSIPNDYNLEAYTFEWDYPLIASNNYFEVYWVDAYKNMEGHDTYQLVFHNKCDLYMRMNLMGLAINEKSIEANLGTAVMPGSVYWHTGTVYSYHSDFLNDYDTAVSIEIEMQGSQGNIGYNQFDLRNKYILDESIVIDYGEYQGQSIYDENNVKMGVQRMHCEYLNQDTLEFYIENNRDQTILMMITPDMTADGQMITEHTYFISVLPNTHFTQQIYMDGNLPKGDAEMSVNFDIKYEYTKRYETKNITFTLLE